MRFMMIVKATKDSEAGVMPSEELLAAMGRYNEELANAGALLAGEGLHPSSKGARVRFSGAQRTVVTGPFAPAHELIAGFWLIQASRWRRRSSGRSAAPIPCRGNPRSRSARCSRPTISARPSRPSSGEQEERLRARSAEQQRKAAAR